MDRPVEGAARSTRGFAIATVALLILALVATWLLHRVLSASAVDGDGRAPLIIAMVWTAVIAVIASLASPRPRLGLLATAAGLLLAWHFQASLSRRIDLIYLAQHAGAHLLLGIGFLRTLSARGGPALITRLAARVHRSALPPDVIRYSRAVTWGWTFYFFAMAAGSLLLHAFGSLEAWSILANLVTLPLIIAGFLFEYVLRRRMFPDFEHVSIFEGIRAYRSPPP